MGRKFKKKPCDHTPFFPHCTDPGDHFRCRKCDSLLKFDRNFKLIEPKGKELDKRAG